MDLTASGKFVKKRLPGMPKHGQYRGPGSLTLSNEALSVTGKHVYSLGQRWAFGLALAFGCLILTLGTFAPGILLVYPVVEYLWLKPGNQSIALSHIRRMTFDPQRQLLAVDFDGTPWETPIVLHSPDGRSIHDAFNARHAQAAIA